MIGYNENIAYRTSLVGKEFICHKEMGTYVSNPFAAAVLKSDLSQVVGCIPRKISAGCILFLDLGGRIKCTITDTHQTCHKEI